MKTQNVHVLFLICLMFLFTFPMPIFAEEETPSASADMAILSKYVWRGYELSNDSVVFQPSATVGFKGFSFNLLGNLDTDSFASNDSDFNETDMTLSYATTLGAVGLDVGYIYYALTGSDTGEFYISTGLDTLLSPTLTVYRDVDAFPGWYVNFGISHSIEIRQGITLDLAGSVGYMDVDDTDYQEMHDGLISVGLTIPLGEYFALSPMIAYSFGLSNKADLVFETGPSAESDFFIGGITLSLAF